MRMAGVFAASILMTGLIWACGSDDKDDKKETTGGNTTTYTFAQANAVIKESCVNNGGCHEVTGNVGKSYADNEANFKAQCAAAGTQSIATRMNGSTGGTQMPQTPKTITAANKQLLIDFCNQK